MSKTRYTAHSIKMEIGAEAHRRNPARYLGAADLVGIKNQLFEIVDNAVDEMIRYSRERNMKDYARIDIEIKEDNTVVVEDYGGGIPSEIHPEYGVPAIYILMESDSSGSKGRNTEGYDDSDPSGINGAGMSVAKSLTTFFELEVKSLSAGGEYFLRYIEGERSEEGLQRIGDLKKDEDGNYITGTKITYHFDPTVFDYQTYMGQSRDEVYSDTEIQNRLREIILGTQGDKLEIRYKYKNNPMITFSDKNVNINDFINVKNAMYLHLHNDPEVFKGDLYIEYRPEQHAPKFTNIVNRMKMVISTSDAPILNTLWDEVSIRLNRDPRRATDLKGYRLNRDTFLNKLNIVFIMTLPTAKYSAQTKNNLTDTTYIQSLMTQMRIMLAQDQLFIERFYEPYVTRLIEDVQWDRKRKREEEKRRERELREKNKTQAQEELERLKNNPLEFELNKDNSKITIKESPKPIGQSTLVYVEGTSAGLGFNDLHKDKEYPIAIAIAEGKVPNVTDPEMIDNQMTIDNRIYCLEVGYKDIAIFTDADADGNHIRLLHLMQIYSFARHYLDEGKVYIVPAPYSTVSLPEYTSIQLYGEVKNYPPGTNYTYSSKEHQSLVNAGGRQLKKFRGLADASISLKELLIHRENWIKVNPLTPLDVELMTKLLQSGSDFKSDFMINVYTDRLYHSNTILNIKGDLSVDRDTVILAMQNNMISPNPEDRDYKSYLTQSGIYDEELAKKQLEEEFDRTHELDNI